MRSILIPLFLSLMVATNAASANDWSNLSKKKQTTLGLYMTPQQAFETMQSDRENVLFVDVRTREEVSFLGMPTVSDANIPYMKLNEWFNWNEKKKNFKMEVNSEFADAIADRLESKQLSKDDKIIFICRSGSRSA
ncbi:MAG: sulfurtransferase, partial [Gammaproteobacteria bacterium]|nr:sulfurtransferase [Gammaproteobacteria bacterium]